MILEVDYIRSLVDNIIAIMNKNDKIKRFKELGSEPSGSTDVVKIVLASAEDKFDELFATLGSISLPQSEAVKFQASLNNFRLALVEDSLKEKPTALVLRVRMYMHTMYICIVTCTCTLLYVIAEIPLVGCCRYTDTGLIVYEDKPGLSIM